MLHPPAPALEQDLAAWVKRFKFEAQVIAVAVSGGADSMALLLALSKVHPHQLLKAFTVDHGLRHGSAAEARWTCQQVKQRGIACDMLPIASVEAGNLQAAARMARYEALNVATSAVNAAALCTAHTLDDQAETILARLSRGSGTKGLSGMQDVIAIPGQKGSQSAALYRPLLGTRRSTLRTYLTEHEQRWAEDPSNANTRFDRIRLREILGSWEDAGFTAERIAAAGENMRRSDDALEHYAHDVFSSVASDHGDSSLTIERSAFLESPADTQLRVLTKCLQAVSENNGPVRMAKLESCLKRIHTGEKSRFTLHGCILNVTDKEVLCAKEA